MSIQDHPPISGTEQSRLVKVRFALPSDDQARGVEAETLWAEQVGPSQYRIKNSPFYVYGVSCGDEVTAAGEQQHVLDFRDIVVRGGHSTYRILIASADGYEDEEFRKAWHPLGQLGCTYEVAKRRWLSVDVPESTNVFDVYRILEEVEGQGIWSFEEGHCGHPTPEITHL